MIGAIYVDIYFFWIAVFSHRTSPVGSVREVRIQGLSNSVTTPPLFAPDKCITIGAGLPPVPAKLVSRIEAEKYIDMTELLPDRLGTRRSPIQLELDVSKEGHCQEFWNESSVLQLTWQYVVGSSLIAFRIC